MSTFGENFVPTVITVTVGAVAISLLFSVGSCIRHDSDKYYETVHKCLETNGTWLDTQQGAYAGMCLRSGSTIGN
mgnify:FL=1